MWYDLVWEGQGTDRVSLPGSLHMTIDRTPKRRLFLLYLHECCTVREIEDHIQDLIDIKFDPLLVWIFVLVDMVRL